MRSDRDNASIKKYNALIEEGYEVTDGRRLFMQDGETVATTGHYSSESK